MISQSESILTNATGQMRLMPVFFNAPLDFR
jgi:hypothetical protein